MNEFSSRGNKNFLKMHIFMHFDTFMLLFKGAKWSENLGENHN